MNELFHEILKTKIEQLAYLDLSSTIIAVDFDGTCVMHDFPKIGADVPGAADVLKALNAVGAKLILWTIRSDQKEISGDPHAAERSEQSDEQKTTEYLKHACQWFEERGIEIHGTNCNPQQKDWSSSPKAYAHIYIDDAALGCPLIHDRSKHSRPFVDWIQVCSMLISRYSDPENIHK